MKKNDLVSSSYSLTLNETRLLLGCISQINPREQLDPNTQFALQITDLIDLFSISSRSTFYDQMKRACERLYNRSVVIRSSKGDTTKLRWIWKVRYEDTPGVIRMNFTADVIPYLTQITETFTKYKLKDVSRFRCVYSLRLYELFQQWKGRGYREIYLDDLRDILSMGSKYKEWSEFRRNVIEKACSEINQFSNLKVEYTYLKRGRQVNRIQFRYETKKRITKKLDFSGKISREVIEKEARVGESWDDAYKRLVDQKKRGK